VSGVRSPRLAGAAAVVLLTLVAAGCGSSKSADTTTTSSTVQWANGLCSAVSTYQASLTAAAKSLTGNLSKSGLQHAADQAKTATDTFVSTTKDLGTPDTESGKKAKSTVDTLSSQLSDDADAVKSASSSSLLTAISTASATLATAQKQITTAFDELKGLDPKGELGDAFSQASSCASLTG
jgi:membrane-associated HD superfamily phosphohydrolase